MADDTRLNAKTSRGLGYLYVGQPALAHLAHKECDARAADCTNRALRVYRARDTGPLVQALKRLTAAPERS
jgi:hypothetical protein